MRVVAYLDANSAGQLMAAVAAGVAGIGVVFRVGWRRFKGVFTRKETPEETAASAADEA